MSYLHKDILSLSLMDFVGLYACLELVHYSADSIGYYFLSYYVYYS